MRAIASAMPPPLYTVRTMAVPCQCSSSVTVPYGEEREVVPGGEAHLHRCRAHPGQRRGETWYERWHRGNRPHLPRRRGPVRVLDRVLPEPAPSPQATRDASTYGIRTMRSIAGPCRAGGVERTCVEKKGKLIIPPSAWADAEW